MFPTAARLRGCQPRRLITTAAAAPTSLPRVLPPRPTTIEQHEWDDTAVLIDKPKTWTSFDVCAKLRSAIGVRKLKVGHAGTLDPMATGLLILCTGKGTKAIDSFQAQDKMYVGVLRLGEATPSYDAETEVTERSPWEHLTDEQIQQAADELTGSILQEPPMYSALKKNGVALYTLARQGETVQREPRRLHVARFAVRRLTPGQDVHFEVACSKGTYVRSLAHDLGRKLGTHAHLTALCRTRIGDYDLASAWALPDLVAACRPK